MKRLVIFIAAFATLAAGCASNSQNKGDGAENVEQQVDNEPASPRYVAFSRLSKIYVAPSEDASFLQYRTPDEQRTLTESMDAERSQQDERVAKRLEQVAEREEERAKRVRKRMRRLRGDRRDRYREREEEREIRKARERAEDALERVVDWAEDHPGEAAHEHVVIAEMVEERGSWVAIRPVRHSDRRCYSGAAPRLSELDVTLWVKRDALMQVVNERTRVPVAHGTEVILARGVAVDASGEVDRALVNGFELGLDIPDESTGYWYEPGRAFEAPYTDTVFTPMAYSDKLLRLSKDAALPYNPWFPLHVTATLYVGDRFYATTQTPCAEFTVRTVEEALEPVGKRAAMSVGSESSDNVTPPMFVAGTALYTPAGDEIGTARRDIPVIEEIEASGDRRCWHYEVWDGDEGVRRLPICGDAASFRGLNLTEGL